MAGEASEGHGSAPGRSEKNFTLQLRRTPLI